ncbi:MAG: peptidoglycan-binding protein [Phenylobacterium sp.]|uniref:peptidoglycan-binding protein n=1 Tax=Phenylobacterium sp. TaxID=1871053 RepID=UPI002733866D|nr:peptidoglycan-binding protein [Phenylobacterium sp.]MDP3175615.1 peptidoglycan-binding protein [Phenylobacterium sp.]
MGSVKTSLENDSMTSGTPWSVKGIDPKAREVAKDLARRSGMTLGEWLNRMILEDETPEEVTSEAQFAGRPSRYVEVPRAAQAGPGRFETVEHPSDELDRVAGAFDRLSERLEASETRTGLVITGVEHSVREAVARIESAEREHVAVAARFEGLAEDIQDGQSRLTERMRRLEQDAAGPRSPEALHVIEQTLGKVASQLYEGESRNSEQFQRLNEAEGKTAEALQSLRNSLAALDARLGGVEQAGAPGVERRLERLADELTRRVEGVRGEIAEQLRVAPDARIERVESKLAEIGEQVRLAEQRQALAVGTMGREVLAMADSLNRRVQKAETRSVEVMDTVGGEVARLAQTVESRLGRTDAVHAQALEKLGAEIARMTERLGERISAAERRSAQAIDEVGDQVVRVTDKISARHDRASEDLAERIRLSEQRTARLLDEARAKIDERLAESQSRGPASYAAAAIYGREPFPPLGPPEPDGLAGVAAYGADVAPFSAERLAPTDFADEDLDPTPAGFDGDAFQPADIFEAEEAKSSAEAAPESDPTIAERAPDTVLAGPQVHDDADSEWSHAANLDVPTAPPDDQLTSAAATETAAFDPTPVDLEPVTLDPVHLEPADERAGLAWDAAPAEALADPDAEIEAAVEPEVEPEGVAQVERPLTTREVIEQARAAARLASQGGEARTRKDWTSKEKIIKPASGDTASAADPAAKSPSARKAPGASLFAGLRFNRGKGGGSTLQTALLVAGGAAFLSVGAAGFVLMEGAPQGAAPKRVAAARDQVGQPIAKSENEALDPFGPNPRAAVALAPREVASVAPAAQSDVDLGALYSAAVAAIDAKAPGGLEQLRKAANLGHAPAQLYLAKVYEEGRAGLPRDLAEARRWTERAASGGDRKAMHNLALYYFEGTGGGAKNAALAAQWFRKAADLGLVDSQYNLGRLYEEGIGVSQNAAEAYKWYLIAARTGDGESRSSAARARAKLTPEGRSVAERSAAGYRPAEAGVTAVAATGAPSAAVMTAQRALSRLGYYQGPRDGSSSPALQMAIAAYQRDQGFVATGALDEVTIARLAVFTR